MPQLAQAGESNTQSPDVACLRHSFIASSNVSHSVIAVKPYFSADYLICGAVTPIKTKCFTRPLNNCVHVSKQTPLS